jgi:hypothetical protein
MSGGSSRGGDGFGGSAGGTVIGAEIESSKRGMSSIGRGFSICGDGFHEFNFT